jgi:hypothetical protein
MAESIKLAPKLTPDRFKEAEYTRRVWAMTPAAGTEVKHLLAPAYWSHVAAKLNPTDRIEVITEDNAWFAEILVISQGGHWAQVKLLRYVQLNGVAAAPAVKAESIPEPAAESTAEITPDDTPEPATEIPPTDSQLVVNYGGVKARHRVMRRSDKVVLKDGFPTQAEAVKWMHEHEVNNLITA